MFRPRLSVILLTTGNQPLIDFSIRSLLSQLAPHDQFAVSINTSDKQAIEKTRILIGRNDPSGRVDILVTPRYFKVYEHYTFAIQSAKFEHALIAHDDEIYNGSILDEFRQGFSKEGVTAVVGGMLKVVPEQYGTTCTPANTYQTSGVTGGVEWIKANPGLYPQFCFSAFSVKKSVLDTGIFRGNSTAADCVAMAQQALQGRVYHSSKILATWLQLPTRNSRWYMMEPGLTAPWREFLQLYREFGDEDLIARAELARERSLKVYVRLLFVIAVYRRNRILIQSCLEKIYELNPVACRLLGPVKYGILNRPLSCLLSVIKAISDVSRKLTVKSVSGQPNPAELLGIDQRLWNEYSDRLASLPR
jgi:hypothetical protein